MKTSIEFLDELKRLHRVTSDYAAAKLLGVHPNRISNYRRGVSAFDDAMAVRVAELLKLRPGYVLASVAAERTHDEKARAAWAEAAEALCIMLTLALLKKPRPQPF